MNNKHKSLIYALLAIFTVLIGWRCTSNNLTSSIPREGVVIIPQVISFSGLERSSTYQVQISNYEDTVVTITGFEANDPAYSFPEVEFPFEITAYGSAFLTLNMDYVAFNGRDTARLGFGVSGLPSQDSATTQIIGPRKVITQNLSNNSFQEIPIDIAPDNSIILFKSNRMGDDRLYTMKTNGTDIKELTDVPGPLEGVRFSESGNGILFYSDNGTSTISYYHILETGQDSVLLDDGNYNIPVDLSSDDAFLLYNVRLSGQFDVFMLELETRVTSNLAQSNVDDIAIAFEPSDRRILFFRPVNGKNQIFKVRTTGTDERLLSDGIGDDVPVAITHDGEFITFATERLNRREVMIFNWDGEDISQTTDDTRFDYPADINNVVGRVLYRTSISGNFQVFEANYRGDGVERLTFDNNANEPICYSRDGMLVLIHSRLPNSQVILVNLSSIR